MKKILIKSGWALAAFAMVMSACNKFEEINQNPKDASLNQVQVEYFINNSIIGAQSLAAVNTSIRSVSAIRCPHMPT